VSLIYPGIPGYPCYPLPGRAAEVRPWVTPIIVLVFIFVITLIGWTPQEILRLLAVLHATG
jgi:hypothetical protein